jgi:hypothetical protein
MQVSKIHSAIDGRKVRSLVAGKDYDVEEYGSLAALGIHGVDEIVEEGYGMDTIQQGVTTPSIPTLVQFLQAWLPGNVMVITAAQKIDELIGIATVGSWHDEQVVQGVLENTGDAVPYGDLTNVPFANWNLNFVARTIVQFEMGMRVGRKEEQRSAQIRVNSAATKRNACAMNLNIQRNLIGFYGYNAGNNNTYGFLNDPNLPAYITVAVGAASSTLWSKKTFLEITADIRTAIVAVRTQSQDTIDPETVDLTLGLPTDAVDYLSVVSDFGISVRDWLKQAYPKVRVVSAPQLNLANGGANVLYLFADRIADQSTDDGRTWVQPVPTKFMTLGVAQQAKGYEEDYSNATAGAMLKRPWAVVRYSGI